MSEQLSAQDRPLTPSLRAILAACILLAAIVRLWGLDRIPPGLWYDEAIYALDGLSVAHGEFRIFYTTENHPREPLYIWSLGAFFATFGHSTWMARFVSALWGIATVMLFYPVARRILEARWALVATFSFAVFRWHVHFSRTIFRALLPPFFILLVVLFFQRWLERRRMKDAALCGFFLGLGMYTYLSFRFVPIMLALWIGWLLWRRIIHWKTDWRALAAVYATAFIVFLPLGIDYMLNPWHFGGRMDEVSMFRKPIEKLLPDGTIEQQSVPKTFGEAGRDLLANAGDVAFMWTFRGDHVGKHNLPYAPVFDWANGILFYFGFAVCCVRIRRDRYALLLISWLVLMGLTSVFSFGAPNILRMQGATPAAILVYVIGLQSLWVVLPRKLSRTSRMTIITALLVVFAAVQLRTYFVKFPGHPQVVIEFQKESFYDPAVVARALAPHVDSVVVSDDLATHPTFTFVTAGVRNIHKIASLDELTTALPERHAILLSQRILLQGKGPGAINRDPDMRFDATFRLGEPDLTGRHKKGDYRHLPWAGLWLNPPQLKSVLLDVKSLQR